MLWNRSRFEKDDPWFMAKVSSINHKEVCSIQNAKSKSAESLRQHEEMRKQGMHLDRFMLFKQSVDGQFRKWGYERNKTLEECRDTTKYPPGKHTDAQGEYVWTYSLDL